MLYSYLVTSLNVRVPLLRRGPYLPRHLGRGGPEAEAGGRVLLLLHALDPGAEVKLHVEAFLRGQVLEHARHDGVQSQRNVKGLETFKMDLIKLQWEFSDGIFFFFFFFKLGSRRRRAPHLVVVLVQHDDDLGHVVEFRDGAEVIHGALPLLVLLLLPNKTYTHTHTQTESLPLTLSFLIRQRLECRCADFEGTYIQQASVAENAEQRVDVTLAGEIQPRPNVAAGGQHAARVPADGTDKVRMCGGAPLIHPPPPEKLGD